MLYPYKPKKGKRGTLSIIKKLGYIQIDTIHIIERAHHLTLRSRISDYKCSFLSDLQSKDRRIFEYWAHAASIVPMNDYRFYLSHMEKNRHPRKGSWLQQWSQKHAKLIKRVYERIEKEGALSAADFKDVPGRKRGPWWDWKPAKTALEVLFWQGKLMVKERRNFRRIYDLTARVLPRAIDTRKPSLEEEKCFFVRRALQSLGIATKQDINHYIEISGNLDPWIRAMEQRNHVVPVRVSHAKNQYYMLANTKIPTIFKEQPIVHLLSPFDNAIILRKRIEELFDFSYALECYKPRAKRKYGYFSLPILNRTHFVGRIDPKADRNTNTLLINNLYFENENILKKEFPVLFASELRRFAQFNGCPHIAFADTVPCKLRTIFKRLL